MGVAEQVRHLYVLDAQLARMLPWIEVVELSRFLRLKHFGIKFSLEFLTDIGRLSILTP